MNSNKFYTADNMKLLINIFKDYMAEKYTFDFDEYESPDDMRKILLKIMTDIREDKRNTNIPLQDTNIQVLAKVKEYYCNKYNLDQSLQLNAQAKAQANAQANAHTNTNKLNIENLNRDKSIYGDRPLKQNILVPESNPYHKKPMNEPVNINYLVNERNNDVNKMPDLPDFNKVANVTKEEPQHQDEFMKRLQDLQDERNKIKFDVNINNNNIENPFKNNDINTDPAALYRNQIQPELKEKDLSIIDNRLRQESFVNDINKIVIPKIKDNNIIVQKYLSINSIDRDWENDVYPERYRYMINFLSYDNDFMNRYRNIDSMEISRIIVPCETSLSTSTSYHISFSLPYVVLNIDEFQDVYDGTNDVIRKSFCSLIYESSYRAPNGRGYIVLKPIQNEKKQFYPAPLSTIQKLTISLLKPNGDLFSKNTDSYQILNIEQDNINTDRLLITLSSYFPQIEFYNSDFILIKQFNITKLVPQQLDGDINSLNNFINRPNGHEIIELGNVNTNGFYNSFYIYIPQTFDKTSGTYIPQTSLINCLNYYNLNNLSTSPNGNILNQSLQHTISFKLNLIVDDAKILDTQSVFSI